MGVIAKVMAQVAKLAGIFKPYQQSQAVLGRRGGMGGGLGGGWDFASAIGCSQEQLRELGKFNTYMEVPELFQRWMLKDVILRAGIIYLGSSLGDRRWTLEGGTKEARDFHGAWLTRLFPQIMEHAALATWYGWMPVVVSYKLRRRWPEDAPDGLEDAIVPWIATDEDPFGTQPLVTEGGLIAGFNTPAGPWARERCVALTWFGEGRNPLGSGQNGVVFPYWLLSSLTRLWAARNAETNLAGRGVAWCKKGLVEVEGGGRAQLASVVGEALNSTSNLDWITLPLALDGTGENAVKLDKFELEDRMESFLQFLAWTDRMKLIGVMLAPAVGFDPDSAATFSEGRTALTTQSAVLQGIGNVPIKALNRPEGLIESVHELNGLAGPPPLLVGQPYSRDQEEILRSVTEKLLTEPLAYVDEKGQWNGLFYKGGDLLEPEDALKQLGFKTRNPKPFARSLEQVMGTAKSDGGAEGGRPREPLSMRQEARNHRLKR